MIYPITYGEYSNYVLCAIVQSDSDVDMDALFQEFLGQTGFKASAYYMCFETMDDDELSVAMWSEQYGMSETKRFYRNHATGIAIFVEWLVRNHGFQRVEYNEFWINDR